MGRQKRDLMMNEILDAVIEYRKESFGYHFQITQIAARAEQMIVCAAQRYLKKWYSMLADKYEKWPKDSMNALERLRLLMVMEWERYRDNDQNTLMYISACSRCLNYAIDRRSPLGEQDRCVRRIVMQCIEEGIQDGSMRKGLNPLDTYLLLCSNFNGMVQRLVLLYKVEEDEYIDRERVFQVFEEYCFMINRYLSG